MRKFNQCCNGHIESVFRKFVWSFTYKSSYNVYKQVFYLEYHSNKSSTKTIVSYMLTQTLYHGSSAVHKIMASLR